ncbi:MAG: HD domain-containing phosphohydrolase [Chloroflexota bacterium]
MRRPVYLPRKNAPSKLFLLEQALQQSRQALLRLIESLPAAVCILNRHDFTYLEANPAYCELIGIPRSLLLNRPENSLPAGIGEHNLKKILARLGAENNLRNLELLIFNQQGALVRSFASVEAIVFDHQPALMITLTRERREDTRPQAGLSESKLTAVGELGRALAQLDDLTEIYRRLSAAVVQLLPDVCTVYISLYDSETQELYCAYGEHEGEAVDLTSIPPLPLQNHAGSYPFNVIHSARPMVIDDLLTHSPTGTLPLPFVRPGRAVRSGVYVPMVTRGRVIGLVQAHSYRPARFRASTDTALLSLVANTAAVAIQNAQLTRSLEQSHLDLNQTYEATIDGWTRALELRDFSTERHSNRVVELTVEMGRRMGLNHAELVKLRRGAQLHDIGKIGIPDAILLKPGPLDEGEWRVMRRHPLYAYELLSPIPHFYDLLDIPYCHHEKWDGSGYPRRLRGEEIPLGARIFAVVDVWDALNSNRPYRSAWQPHQVVDYLRYQSNRHFQAEVVDLFLDLIGGYSGGSAAPRGPLFTPGRFYSTRLR